MVFMNFTKFLNTSLQMRVESSKATAQRSVKGWDEFYKFLNTSLQMRVESVKATAQRSVKGWDEFYKFLNTSLQMRVESVKATAQRSVKGWVEATIRIALRCGSQVAAEKMLYKNDRHQSDFFVLFSVNIVVMFGNLCYRIVVDHYLLLLLF